MCKCRDRDPENMKIQNSKKTLKSPTKQPDTETGRNQMDIHNNSQKIL